MVLAHSCQRALKTIPPLLAAERSDVRIIVESLYGPDKRFCIVSLRRLAIKARITA